MSKSSVVQLRSTVLKSSAERQLCGSEFQAEGALALKATVDNETVILGTDSNSVSVDNSVRSGRLVVNRVREVSRSVSGSRNDGYA